MPSSRSTSSHTLSSGQPASTPEPSGPTPSDFTHSHLTKHRLALERCRLLARQVVVETAAAVLMVILVFLILDDDAPQYDQLAWAASVAVNQGVRVQCARRLLPRQLVSAQTWFAITAILSGILVGAPLSLFTHLISLNQALALALIAIGWLALTAGMHTAFRSHALAHSALIFIQMALAWAHTPFPAPELGLPALLLYAVLLAQLGAKTQATFSQSVTQAIERRHLVRKLAQATRQARQAHQAARQFLACASHDLRQPASALSLLSTLLRERCKDPALFSLAEGIERSSKALGGLLDSLLDLSRLDAGVVEPQLQWVPIETLFSELRLEFEARTVEKGLSFHIGASSASLYCDPILLGRCLRNLLDNAVRYTSTGGVTLSVHHASPGLTLKVCDSGIGIAPEMHARIFEDHFQIEGRHPEASRGLGLGLAIVKRLAVLMSADISVQSDGKNGSCFSLRFLDTHFQSYPQTSSCSTAGNHNRQALRVTDSLPRILLVEDDAAVAHAMTLLLRRRAQHVDHVFSVESALHRLQNGHFNVLVTDLRLPGAIDGLHLIEHARQIHPEIKCLLATADADSQTQERARNAAVPLLLKPLTQSSVEKALLQSGYQIVPG